MPLAPANQPQLIRSSQKDDYYQTCLKNNANEVFQAFSGSRQWLKWRREVELLSDLAYYSLTTFSGYQTLGEEYVNIVQVDPTKRRVPSLTRRGAFVLLHTFAPYLLDKLLVCVENELEGEDRPQGAPRDSPTRWNPMFYIKAWVQRAVAALTENQRKNLVPVLYAAQQGVAIIHRIHVALFYISSSYYHISKRATGISYLRVVSGPRDERAIHTSYRLLGAVSLLQLVITLLLQARNLRQRQRARQEWRQHRNLPSSMSSRVVSSPSSRASRCILCLEERRHATATPCGHLFCWECITEWCSNKSECPLCREKFQPHRLVYLRGYK